MSQSTMVLAEKYELQVKIPGSTAYSVKGQKKLVHGKKLVPRIYVEQRNSHANNELYVVYEEETEKLMEQREKNIIENAEKAKREQVSMADLVDKVAGNASTEKEVANKPKEEATATNEAKENASDDKGAKETPKAFDKMEVDELKQYCKDNDIQFHPASGIKKLLELVSQ